ncbi:MAG: hypothetical protein R3B99_29805 [Polyangiales bacterium]
MRSRSVAGSMREVYGWYCVAGFFVVSLALGAVGLLALWGVGGAHEALSTRPGVRAWRRRRALRREARELARGRWRFLDEAHREVGDASIARALDPVVKLEISTKTADRGFVIGRGTEGEVRLVHEADARFVEVGGRRLELEAWLHACFERARAAWLEAAGESYREARTLPSWMTPALPEGDPLVRLAACPIPYRVPPEPASSYRDLFEAWKERRSVEATFSDDDARALFAEHDEASSWEVIGEPFEPDGFDDVSVEKPFLLRASTGRVVTLCFDAQEPWVRAAHADVDAYVRAEVVLPHVIGLLSSLEGRALAAAVLPGG